MKQSQLIATTIILALLAGYIGSHIGHSSEQAASVAKSQSVYDRVMATKTLRCGYINWPPLSSKNPNTGHMEGMYVDLTNEMAKGLGWKVEWIEEVSMTDFITALNTDRVDMMCAPTSPTPARSQLVYFSHPHLYTPYYGFVKTGNTAFDNNVQSANTPNTRIGYIEGELAASIVNSMFPKAQKVEITAQQGPSQLFDNVATGKADIVFQDPFTFDFYNKSNPGKLQKINAPAVGFFSAGFAMKMGDERFKWVVDSSVDDMLNRGYIQKLLAEYHLTDFGILAPADGFKK
jgi:ABC-type amino acid transport substrate-binding protein